MLKSSIIRDGFISVLDSFIRGILRDIIEIFSENSSWLYVSNIYPFTSSCIKQHAPAREEQST